MWTCYKRLSVGINLNRIICVSHKSHYEVLNIKKNATHKEIKDAYYRLSMIYHPDKNKGCEIAAKNFRDITSAYEVLGNVRQKKLYDSGTNPARKNQQYNTKGPFQTMKTKSDIDKTYVNSRDFNFDEWSKAHYTNAFQRHQFARDTINRNKGYEEYTERQNTYSLLIIFIFVTTFILFSMFERVKHLVNGRNRLNELPKENSKNDEN